MNALLEPSPGACSLEEPQKTSRKILIADDDPGIRQMLTRLLKEEDYTVISAANGIEALKLAEKVEPDLVLLDLNMPDKDGWDTYAQLISTRPELPIIVITARQYQYLPARFSGVGALMEKPLNLSVLLETIRELLERSGEVHLPWITGKPAGFHYVPPKL